MNGCFLETERTVFSRWTSGSLPLAAQLWGEKDVTRYICASGVFTEREIWERVALEIKNGREFGVQYWPFFRRETEELIGCCGLRPYKAETDSYEIGFHLRKKYWGQGYAYEAANAVIGYAFSVLRAEKIFAGHHPQNIASKSLLVRLGFQPVGAVFYAPTGLSHPSYLLRNPVFAGAKE